MHSMQCKKKSLIILYFLIFIGSASGTAYKQLQADFTSNSRPAVSAAKAAALGQCILQIGFFTNYLNYSRLLRLLLNDHCRWWWWRWRWWWFRNWGEGLRLSFRVKSGGKLRRRSLRRCWSFCWKRLCWGWWMWWCLVIVVTTDPTVVDPVKRVIVLGWRCFGCQPIWCLWSSIVFLFRHDCQQTVKS